MVLLLLLTDFVQRAAFKTRSVPRHASINEGYSTDYSNLFVIQSEGGFCHLKDNNENQFCPLFIKQEVKILTY